MKLNENDIKYIIKKATAILREMHGMDREPHFFDSDTEWDDDDFFEYVKDSEDGLTFYTYLQDNMYRDKSSYETFKRIESNIDYDLLEQFWGDEFGVDLCQRVLMKGSMHIADNLREEINNILSQPGMEECEELGKFIIQHADKYADWVREKTTEHFFA